MPGIVSYVALGLIGLSPPIHAERQAPGVMTDRPAAGRYVARDGREFELLAKREVLRIRAVTGTPCLDLRPERMPDMPEFGQLRAQLGLVSFAGHFCGESMNQGRPWLVMFSKAKPRILLIYPPDVFKNRSVTPIELELVGRQH